MGAVVVEDLTINQGEDWTYRWVVSDPVTGNPMDMTGWSGKGEVRLRPGSPVLHTWSTVLANMSLGADGTCTITVSNAVSTAMVWGDSSARYDIELTNLSGKKVRLAEGNVALSLEVTQ